MNNPLVKNIVQTFSTQVGSQCIAIISGIVVARTLGPAGKGFFSYAGTALSFAYVFFYGFSDAILYQFGKQQRSATAVYAVAIRNFVVVIAIIVTGLIGVAIAFPSQRPLAAAAAVIPFAMYTHIITPFLMVREQLPLVNFRTIAQNVGTAALTIPLLIFTHLGLNAVIGVWIFFYALAAAYSVWAVRPIVKSSTAEQLKSTDISREQIRFGLRAAGASGAGFLNLRIDVFVVSFLFAPAAVGWYTLAIASGELMWQVSRAFLWSAMGRIGSSSLSDSAALVARMTRNTLAIVGSLGMVAFITGPWLIVHVYGEAFAPAGSALRWALPGLIAYASEVALTSFLVVQLGRSTTLIWVQCASAVACAVLTFATAGRFGIVAAAASTSLTYLTVTTVLIALFLRGTGVSLARLLLIQREDLRHYASLLDGVLRTLRLRSA